MALLGQGPRSLLATWWSLIEQGVAGGFSITDVVSATASLARDIGQPLTFEQSQGVSTLFSYAFRMNNASNALLAADPADTLDSSMIARAPWGRDLQEQDTSPSWQVKFTMTFRDPEGTIQTEVKTSLFDQADMPETVGDLSDAITQDAQGFALKYEVELLSAQPYQILAV